MKKYFMKKINLLQIVIHLTATLFFIFSLRTFSGLYNFKILKLISENGVENTMRNMDKFGLTKQDIWTFSFATNISGLIGIILALNTTRKTKYFLIIYQKPKLIAMGMLLKHMELGM